MSDLLIYGLEIDTVANLGVAIGTLLMAVVTGVMAWLTHLSLKSSKEQLDIQKKQLLNQEIEFGKSEIVDQMDLVLKPLREEMIFEIKKIQSPPINFYKSSGIDSLKFPIPPSKKFFIANSKPEKLESDEIPIYYTIRDLNRKYPHLAATLENRYHTYLQIASNITNIENELRSEDSKKMIEELVKKYCHPQHELIYDGSDYWDDIVYILEYEDETINGITASTATNIYPITVYEFLEDIIRILSYEIWDVDLASVDSLDEDIVTESSDVRRDFIEMNKESEIWQLKEDVNDHLNELLNADRDLITLIDTIISEYKEKYHLSAEQLTPFGI